MLTREQLRVARTKFVHRWHAAQTIGEQLGNDAVGERFEHINHARSLAEYVWRYGVFEESADGTGRVARPDMPYGLRDVVTPVAARGGQHLRLAARYALMVAGPGGDGTESSGGGRMGVLVPADRPELLRYAEQHPEIKLFTAGIIALHRGMLQYYVQMRYLTPVEAERYRSGAMPLFAPLPRPGASAVRESSADADASIGDPVAALRGAFARNLYNALVARAQSELLETVTRHPDGRTLAVDVPEHSPHHARGECTTTAIVQRRRKRFRIRDDALAAMLQSLDEEPMPPVIRWLAAFKTAVSAMITTMPMFIVKNFFRDTLSGFVAGRYWQVPIISTLAGSVHAIRDLTTGRSDAMREYLLQGGFSRRSWAARAGTPNARGTRARRCWPGSA